MDSRIFDRISVQIGDITRIKVDAIVNAANKSLLGGGGVDGAIHNAAGPRLLAQCKTLGGCRTGEAKITKGYDLIAKYVIHTVGPIYSGTEKDPVALANCYKNSLGLAKDYGLATIAFPAISCGVYGYPIKDACEVATNTVCEFLAKSGMPQKVTFVLFGEPNFLVYENFLKTRMGQ